MTFSPLPLEHVCQVMIDHFLFSVVAIFKMAAIMEIPIIGDYYNSGTIINIGAMHASLPLEFTQSKNKIMLFPNGILVKI